MKNENENESIVEYSYESDEGDESISCREEVENRVLPDSGVVDFVPPP